MKRNDNVGQIALPFLKAGVCAAAWLSAKRRSYIKKKIQPEREREDKEDAWMEYYLDCILIWTDSLFLGCNTPTKVFHRHHKKKRECAEKVHLQYVLYENWAHNNKELPTFYHIIHLQQVYFTFTVDVFCQ